MSNKQLPFSRQTEDKLVPSQSIAGKTDPRSDEGVGVDSRLATKGRKKYPMQIAQISITAHIV
jgi:hypothetical protein